MYIDILIQHGPRLQARYRTWSMHMPMQLVCNCLLKWLLSNSRSMKLLVAASGVQAASDCIRCLSSFPTSIQTDYTIHYSHPNPHT